MTGFQIDSWARGIRLAQMNWLRGLQTRFAGIADGGPLVVQREQRSPPPAFVRQTEPSNGAWTTNIGNMPVRELKTLLRGFGEEAGDMTRPELIERLKERIEQRDQEVSPSRRPQILRSPLPCRPGPPASTARPSIGSSTTRTTIGSSTATGKKRRLSPSGAPTCRSPRTDPDTGAATTHYRPQGSETGDPPRCGGDVHRRKASAEFGGSR